MKDSSKQLPMLAVQSTAPSCSLPSGGPPGRGSVPAAERTAGGTAVTTSGLAVGACVACCVLPLALPAVLVAAGGGVFAWMERAQAWTTPVALIAVAGSWLWIWRQSVRTGARPARSSVYVMGVATLFAGVAISWPLIEPPLVRFLRG